MKCDKKMERFQKDTERTWLSEKIDIFMLYR